MNNQKELVFDAEKLEQLVQKSDRNWRAEIEQEQQDWPWRKKAIAMGFRILDRLDELNMTQKQLAEKLGVSAPMVNRWVKGKEENMGLKTICQLEKILGIDLMVVARDTSLPMEKNVITLSHIEELAEKKFGKALMNLNSINNSFWNIYNPHQTDLEKLRQNLIYFNCKIPKKKDIENLEQFA